MAAVRDGWQVTLIRPARRNEEAGEATEGPLTIVRVACKDAFRRHVKWQPPRRPRALLTQFGLRTRADLEAHRAAHLSWLSDEELRLAYGDGAPRSLFVRARNALRRKVFDVRYRTWRWEGVRSPRKPPAADDWRQSRPNQVDADLVLLPVLVKLAPDVIHAGDIAALSATARAAARLRVRGHKVGWVYDAREYDRDGAADLAAIEREFIPAADRVVAATPPAAEAVRAAHRLPRTPVVVRDVPVRSTIDTESDPPSLRTAARLGEDTPLLVYAGAGSERDLATVVDALVELPEWHFAIVAGEPLHNDFRLLLKAAAKEGALSRVHIVPPVPPSFTPAYLSTADLGLIGSPRMVDHELSSPANLGEYLHAGVPVIGSSALADLIDATGVGRVFTSGDASSVVEALRKGLAAREE
ncbi:hypothetical protein AB0M20_36035, partial [Actinoplanes sp. NPDC051633]